MIIGVLADVWVEDVIETTVGVFTTNVRTDLVIGALPAVQVEVIIDVACNFGAEVLADANTSVLVAAMTTLPFAMSSP